MVRSWLVALGMVVALASTADAKMMENFDLAGLALDATVVLADYVGAGATAGTEHFHVTKTLRGTSVADFDVDISLYNVPPNAAKRMVLFLATYNGKPYVKPSGLRVFVDGKAWRFVQQNNPGGFAAVPQGPDPQDQWTASSTQLDEAGLLKAIAAAGKRVDAADAAERVQDPTKRRAALFAVLPPEGASRASSFYADSITTKVEAVLAAGGDLEGALLAEGHDHTDEDMRVLYGTPAELLAYAVDVKHAGAVRARALRVLMRFFETLGDVTVGATVRGLIADPDAGVRSAALELIARPANASSSDAAEQKKLTALVKAAKLAATQRWAVETDPNVLFTIATVFGDRVKLSLPPRAGIPTVLTRTTLVADSVFFEAVCTKSLGKRGTGALTMTSGGQPATGFAYNFTYRCGATQLGEGGGGSGGAMAPGRYSLVLALTFDKQTTPFSVGTLVRAANGESQLEP